MFKEGNDEEVAALVHAQARGGRPLRSNARQVTIQ